MGGGSESEWTHDYLIEKQTVKQSESCYQRRRRISSSYGESLLQGHRSLLPEHLRVPETLPVDHGQPREE